MRVMACVATCLLVMAALARTTWADSNDLQYSMKRFYYSDAQRTVDYNFTSGAQNPIGGVDNVDQIAVPESAITYPGGQTPSEMDKINFVFNINHDHFLLDTSAASLVLSGTFDTPAGCYSYGCSAAGGMEYTNGIFSMATAQPLAATAFFHSVRLAEFKAFSSEKYNAFTYGFQGNNLTGAESCPQARITAKWIKGFYCGRLFTGQLVLETTIYNNYNVLRRFSVANGGGYAIEGLTDPATAVVDLAIEATDNGATVNFYYRVGGGATAMDKASGGWVLYNTYANTGTAFYGYPVNKGLMSLTASDLTYPPDVPTDISINTGKGVSVSASSSVSASADDLKGDYRVVNFQPVSGEKRIAYACTPGSLTAIRSSFSGLAVAPSAMTVVKLKSNGASTPFRTYRTSFDSATSGDWAIADPSSGNFIASGQTLTAGKEYSLYLFIADNDAVYDLNPASGLIEDPAVLGTGSPSVLGRGAPVMLLLDNQQ